MKHSGKEFRIGSLLVDRGLITNDQLQSAIEIQRATHNARSNLNAPKGSYY